MEAPANWGSNAKPRKPKVSKIDRMRAEIAKQKMSKLPKEPVQQRDDAEVNAELVASVPGLVFIPDFITEQEEELLIQAIDKQTWDNDLKRRVQQYGYRFHHESQQIRLWKYENNEKLPAAEKIPSFLDGIRNRLVEQKVYDTAPDQVIINEYEPGQGIHPHTDKSYCFHETIASLSLLSPIVMDFAHKRTFQKVSILLPARSLIVLTKEARYDWTHGITCTTTNSFNGKETPRGRRISVTFRQVIQEYIQKLKQ